MSFFLRNGKWVKRLDCNTDMILEPVEVLSDEIANLSGK
jgi:hypothetical protein